MAALDKQKHGGGDYSEARQFQVQWKEREETEKWLKVVINYCMYKETLLTGCFIYKIVRLIVVTMFSGPTQLVSKATSVIHCKDSYLVPWVASIHCIGNWMSYQKLNHC